MLKFSIRKKICPLVGLVGAGGIKVDFYLLVGAFCLSVSLGVICSGKANIIFKESCQLSGKCGGELRSSVRDKDVI